MEVWDLYDRNRQLLGMDLVRGEDLPKDCFHLVVHAWILNSKGQYLISQRSEDRESNPLMWECVGGSVIKGETSLEAAVREVKEEVGVLLNPTEGKFLFSALRENVKGKKFNDILDVWLFKYDGNVDLHLATTSEVCNVKWMTSEEILQLYNCGKLVPTLSYFFDKKFTCDAV